MAPEARILKRVRSRPAEWWAANPAPSIQPRPTAAAPKAKIATSLNAVGSSGGNMQEGLKRKRSRPSEWWVGSPSTNQSTILPSSQHPAKKTKPQPVVSVAQPAEHEDSKRRRSRPSDWWAVKSSTVGENEQTPHSSDDNENLIVKPGRRSGKLISGNSVDMAGKKGGKLATAQGAANAIIQVQQVEGKRGGRPKLSRRKEDSTLRPLNKAPGTPPKRAMPRVQVEDAKATTNEPKQPRRGHSSKIEAGQAAIGSAQELGIKESKRILTNKEPEVPSSKGKTGQKHGSQQNPDPAPPIQEQETGGRKRTRASDLEIMPLPHYDSLTKAQPSKRARGSYKEPDVVTASSTFAKTRPGPGKRANPVVVTRKSAIHEEPNPKKPVQSSGSEVTKGGNRKVAKTLSKNPRRQDEDVHRHKQKAGEGTEEEVPKGNYPRIREPDDEKNYSDEAPLYQHLAAVTRKVSRQTIKEKWESLPPTCVKLIAQLLADAQKPVVTRVSGENKRAQASTALQTISRRFVSKITKGVPFPQRTNRQREDDFDFERIIDHNRVLDTQLTAEMDSNKLLDANLRKELALLESEKTRLAELQKNARSEVVAMKQAERKLHPLLQPDDYIPEDDLFNPDSLGVVSNTAASILGAFEDEDLQVVVKELEGHVNSISGNLKQVDGITEAMAKAKAAVQVTLFDHLDITHYEEVLLG